jgi:hypothetical protein
MYLKGGACDAIYAGHTYRDIHIRRVSQGGEGRGARFRGLPHSLALLLREHGLGGYVDLAVGLCDTCRTALPVSMPCTYSGHLILQGVVSRIPACEVRRAMYR